MIKQNEQMTPAAAFVYYLFKTILIIMYMLVTALVLVLIKKLTVLSCLINLLISHFYLLDDRKVIATIKLNFNNI